MMHYIAVFLFLYVVLLLIAPQHVLAATLLAFASAWSLVDWTTVPWIP